MEWQSVANGFQRRWNFPNCIGAIDGKHIVLQKPLRSGSTYINYKHTFSIVLMAVVDSNYRFIYVDVGAQGRISDAGVFNNCSLNKLLQKNRLNIPGDKILPNAKTCSPFVLVADDAFPLRTYIMKPFHRRGLVEKEMIFNYRLSRCRRVVENAFGILANRFRVFRSPITSQPSSVKKVVLAATALHNYLRTKAILVADVIESVDVEDVDSGVTVAGDWRRMRSLEGMKPLAVRGGRISRDAKHVRNELSEYFMNAGAIYWQWRSIGKEDR
jgi:hypothetical protein